VSVTAGTESQWAGSRLAPAGLPDSVTVRLGQAEHRGRDPEPPSQCRHA